MEKLLVPVDQHDLKKDFAPKLQACQKGFLQRAASFFILDRAGCLFLQKRVVGKYRVFNEGLQHV
ncbi:Isopentenyl-diphosphate Delta-isomerase [compost metagenome]|jgi:isopentenyl-diphosphate delta-isomerase